MILFPRAVYSATPARVEFLPEDHWRGFLVAIQVFAVDAPAELITPIFQYLHPSSGGANWTNVGAGSGQFGAVIETTFQVVCSGDQALAASTVIDTAIPPGIQMRMECLHVNGARPTEYAVGLVPYKRKD